MAIEKIGVISKTVISVLKLEIKSEQTIFMSNSTYEHILEKHPEDFERFRDKIPEILEIPDYVGINPKDDSIEYIKEFKIEDEFVKVAVRVSGGGMYWVRTMYSVQKHRIHKFKKGGRFKKLD